MSLFCWYILREKCLLCKNNIFLLLNNYDKQPFNWCQVTMLQHK